MDRWNGVERRNAGDFDNTRDLVVETHTKMDALYNSLMGNGQPGIIKILSDSVEALDTRVQSLEGWKRWVHGISAAIGAIGATVAALWHYIIVVRVGKS